ncbi:hypothetical protein AURDEDRAFT_150126 [Auricularia subglabra TFB-10046 SS5]|nr:hypothetical protein AURDEDRAFT_150126 [Auricularia subglabra TFB-10046 SS5]
MSDALLSTYVDAARRRRATAEDDLAVLEKREREIGLAFDDASAQLRIAVATVDALATERLEIQAHAAALRAKLRDMPSTFDSRILHRLPTELLNAVFDEIASEPDPWVVVPDKVFFNAERASAPFMISSVCHRWRDIALGMPGLWTYIALPALSASMGRSIYGAQLHVQRLLHRSGSKPLDVLLRWAEDDAQWEDLAIFREIVSIVAQQMKRWRRACFDFPLGIDVKGVEFLRCPAPLLEEFAIWSAGDKMLPSLYLPEYLPNSPRLRTFCSGTIFLAPRAALPSLRQAHITCDDHPVSAVWDVVGKMPALEELVLTFINPPSGPPDPPLTELRLSNLRSLTVEGNPLIVSTWAAMLSLPQVQQLTLPVWSIAALEPLIVSTLTGISELTVIADLADEVPILARGHAEILSLFTRLRVLVLACGVILTPDFMDRLILHNDSVVLPDLNRLVLAGLPLLVIEAESAVSFVKARHRMRDSPGAEGRPPATASITQFTVELIDVRAPVWFVPQLEQILGDGLVVHHAPNEHPKAQQEIVSNSDESEAEFTADEGDDSSESKDSPVGVFDGDEDDEDDAEFIPA